MEYTFAIIVGGLVFTLYLLATSQNPAQAAGFNRFEEASTILSTNP